ncbi:MAG: hypothetical protein GY757_01470 [bacterium]|nr:hypothetical protein [bacterium]
MKKIIAFIIIALCLTPFAFTQDSLKLLRLDIPAKGKTKLTVNMEDLNKILGVFDLKEKTANIELNDTDGNVLATLGKIKKGTIKWGHKSQNETLLVKFKKNIYKAILEKIKAKEMKPGYLIRVMEPNNLEEMPLICEITFAEVADLTVKLKYPVKAMPGEAIGKDLAVTIENKGTTAAENFEIQLVLSTDHKIPVKPAAYSDTFADDVLLKDGSQTIPSIKPGESLTVTMKESVQIPGDISPARYYVGVVADPGNKIPELNEENNTFASFIMISAPQVKRFTLELPETVLVYDPTTYALSVQCGDIALSDGKDWRKCNIRPFLQQLKHATWKTFLWETNTVENGLWEIETEKFCKKGGKAKEINIKLDINGGSKTTSPKRLTLNLADTVMSYEPPTRAFKISTYGKQIAWLPFWRVVMLKPHLYQVKFKLWQGYFWEVDTFKKTINKITGGVIGEQGGTATPLNMKFSVEQ